MANLENSIVSGTLNLTPQDAGAVLESVREAVHGGGNLVSTTAYKHAEDVKTYAITDAEMDLGRKVHNRVKQLLPHSDNIGVSLNKRKTGVELGLGGGDGKLGGLDDRKKSTIITALLGAALATNIPVKDYTGKPIKGISDTPSHTLVFDSIVDVARTLNAVTCTESAKIPLPHSARVR